MSDEDKLVEQSRGWDLTKLCGMSEMEEATRWLLRKALRLGLAFKDVRFNSLIFTTRNKLADGSTMTGDEVLGDNVAIGMCCLIANQSLVHDPEHGSAHTYFKPSDDFAAVVIERLPWAGRRPARRHHVAVQVMVTARVPVDGDGHEVARAVAVEHVKTRILSALDCHSVDVTASTFLEAPGPDVKTVTYVCTSCHVSSLKARWGPGWMRCPACGGVGTGVASS